MKIGYYPGCSLHATAQAYDKSTQAVCNNLDVEMVEIPDWSCCGSTPAHQQDHLLALSLSSRNIALAEKAGLNEIAAPCAACFSHLKAASQELKENPETEKKVSEILGMNFTGKSNVRNLIDLMVSTVGLDKIQARVKKPLKGLKVVPYYGCLLTRPHKITEFDHPTNPTSLNKILEVLGADVLEWDAKTDCCGGSYSLTYTDVVVKHSGNIIFNAKNVGADMIVTACPLCWLNLETRQGEAIKAAGEKFKMPVVYFTELMGVAFGLSKKELGLSKHIINPLSPLQKHKII